jgi:hypothetical protein
VVKEVRPYEHNCRRNLKLRLLGKRVGHEMLFFCAIHVRGIKSELLLQANLETVRILDFAAHTCKISDISESGDSAQQYFRFLKFLIIFCFVNCASLYNSC